MPRQSFDLVRAREQHATYVTALRAAGAVVTVLPEEPDMPDATFVEDTVLMLDEVAVLCRPGVVSRELEVTRMADVITALRPMQRIATPGTLEGGDVLRLGKALYVGLSSRTNDEGIRQLQTIVSQFGYSVTPVRVNGCLHLKTGATSPGEGLLLANPEWIDVGAFCGIEILTVAPGEPWGANTLPVNETVLAADSSPRTADALESRGLKVQRLAISELQMAEAGLTCLSVCFRKSD